MLRWETEQTPVVGVLREITTLELQETPLTEMAEYLTELHEFPVVLVGREIADMPISIALSDCELHWALQLTLFKHGLDWFADEERIYVGTPRQIAEHRQEPGPP